MSGDEEEIQITITLKQAAIICLVGTSYLAMAAYGDMKEPLTGTPIEEEMLVDIAEIIERINIAVGNEPSIDLRKFIYKMREKQGG